MNQTSQDDAKCPLCGGAMENGYIPDHGHGRVYESSWYAGAPEPSLFLGDIKWPKGSKFPLEAYRCTQCGYLMMFARRKVE
jgi:hypothetical protein